MHSLESIWNEDEVVQPGLCILEGIRICKPRRAKSLPISLSHPTYAHHLYPTHLSFNSASNHSSQSICPLQETRKVVLELKLVTVPEAVMVQEPVHIDLRLPELPSSLMWQTLTGG